MQNWYLKKLDPIKAITGLIAVFFVAVQMLNPTKIVDSDTFWHIATGRWIVENQAIPVVDPFSWSAPGIPWLAFEWLFDIFIYLFSRIGPAGVYLFSVLLISLGLYLFWRLLNKVSQSKIVLIIIFLSSLFVMCFTWVPRPQLISYIGFIILLTVLISKDGKKFRYLPVIFLLWANFHPAALIGLAVFGVYVVLTFIPAFESGALKHSPLNRKTVLATFCASLFASCINPSGFTLWVHSFKTLNEPVFKWICEWQSPSHLFHILSIALIITAVIVAIITNKRNKIELFTVTLAVGTLLAVLTSVRHFPFFTISWAVMLLAVLKDIKLTPRLLSPIWGLVLGVAAFSLISVGWIGNDFSKLAERADYPVGAVEWLKENHAERVINHYNYGGYMIFMGVPVFVDGRADMYYFANKEDNAYSDWVKLFLKRSDSPEKAVEKYDADYILLNKNHPTLMYLSKCGYEERYRDDIAVIVEKPGS